MYEWFMIFTEIIFLNLETMSFDDILMKSKWLQKHTMETDNTIFKHNFLFNKLEFNHLSMKYPLLFIDFQF